MKTLELSSEYFGRYCKKLLNQFLFNIFQDIQLQSSVPSWYSRGHCIPILWSFLYLTMHFQIGKWRFSVWVNMTILTYLTCIVRCKSDTMKKVDMCYCVVKKLELSSQYFGRYCKRCWISFYLISSKIFSCKLQFLHDMIEDIVFYHCGYFQTLQYIFK